MNAKGWDSVVLSDVAFEELIAELYYDGQFILVMDQEEGRDRIKVAFPPKTGELGSRIDLIDFLDRLASLVNDLKK